MIFREIQWLLPGFVFTLPPLSTNYVEVFNRAKKTWRALIYSFGRNFQKDVNRDKLGNLAPLGIFGMQRTR